MQLKISVGLVLFFFCLDVLNGLNRTLKSLWYQNVSYLLMVQQEVVLIIIIKKYTLKNYYLTC